MGIVGRDFVLDHAAFRFAGANNYYLIYKSRFMADAVFEAARNLGLRAIRTWGFIDRGSLDGTVADSDPPGHKDGVYFQYWDPQRGAPAYNDGPDGLERLDYVVHRAAELGLKLIIPLVNNWKHFGGVEQYRIWYGLGGRDDFYSDPRSRRAYRNWVAHLLNRTNTLTGRRFADEPAILAWELANEPRCASSAAALLRWVDQMSSFIRDLDSRHLVAVGDEGFFRRPWSGEWMYDGSTGGDFEAFLRLPAIDFGTFHLYPEDWGKDAAWGVRWIREHLEAGARAGKPVLLEEYGWKDQATREATFEAWHSALLEGGAPGSLVWMLAAAQDDGTLYPDYDGFTIYETPEAPSLAAYARRLGERSAPAAV